MPVSEAQKRANRKWRETHREHFYSHKKIVDKKYYENHKDEICKRQNKKYYLMKEFFRLSQIMI